jgi:hypothetical protein
MSVVDDKSITLEDVETAIKIINRFLRQQRDAVRVLRQLGVREGRSSSGIFNTNDIMSMAMEMQKRKQGLGATEEPSINDDVTPEELERIRKIKEEIKKGNRG